jgi:thioredoxin-like negative regulator of GroEL
MKNNHSIVEITPASFDSHVRQSPIPVLIAVFSEKSCGNSVLLDPLEEVASSQPEKLRFVRINLDEHPEFAGQLGIMATPALLLLQAGEVNYQYFGQWSRADVANILARAGMLEFSFPVQKLKTMAAFTSRHAHDHLENNAL